MSYHIAHYDLKGHHRIYINTGTMPIHEYTLCGLRVSKQSCFVAGYHKKDNWPDNTCPTCANHPDLPFHILSFLSREKQTRVRTEFVTGYAGGISHETISVSGTGSMVQGHAVKGVTTGRISNTGSSE